MKKRKLGLVSVGQSPRSDDVAAVLGQRFDVLEYGLLDAYTHEQVQALFAPGPEDTVLCPRMREGPPARVAAKHISALLQQAIPTLESKGCELILAYGQGIFPPLEHRVLLIEPYKIARGILQAICGCQRLGVIVPDPQMIASLPQEFPGLDVTGYSVYAYHTDKEKLRREFLALDHTGVDLFFLNCGSFTDSDRDLLREITGKPVLLSRGITEKVLMELL